MDIYQKELQAWRIDDEIQAPRHEARDKGYAFIPTASHGYLVVPIDDKNIAIAKNICKYGYIGDHAIYLEEDSEAGEFIAKI